MRKPAAYMPMALCFRYREAMTAGHDAVTFKGMIVKTVLMTACVVAALHGFPLPAHPSVLRRGTTDPLHLQHLVIERPHVGRSRRVNALEGFLVVDAL